MHTKINIKVPRELIANVLDNVDDLLDKHNIIIPCDERKDIDEPAPLCGKPYDDLMDNIISTLESYGIEVSEGFNEIDGVAIDWKIEGII